MDQQEMKQMAGEISQVLRTMNSPPEPVAAVEKPVKPAPPDTTYLNESAKRQATMEHDAALVKYAENAESYTRYVLSKPESSWTADEIRWMASQISKFLSSTK